MTQGGWTGPPSARELLTLEAALPREPLPFFCGFPPGVFNDSPTVDSSSVDVGGT